MGHDFTQVVCRVCDGTGSVVQLTPTMEDGSTHETRTPCASCGGTGVWWVRHQKYWNHGGHHHAY